MEKTTWKRTDTWKTKDGRELRICDMEESHIRNLISMLRKKRYVGAKEHSSDEPGPPPILHGEHAQDAAEREWTSSWDRWLAQKPTTLLDVLEQELELRKGAKK